MSREAPQMAAGDHHVRQGVDRGPRQRDRLAWDSVRQTISDLRTDDSAVMWGATEQAEARRRRAMSSLWLLWIVFPLWTLLTSAHPVTVKTAGVVGSLAFIGTYLGLMLSRVPASTDRAGRRQRYLLVACLVVLDVVLIAGFGYSWTTLSVFTSIMTAIVLPWRVGIVATLAVLAYPSLLGQAVGWTAADVRTSWYTAVAWLLVTIVLRLLVRSRANLRDARAGLAQAAITNAVSDERLRFSRDLHDLLGHSLTVIVVKSELAKRLARTDPDKAMLEVADIEKIAREALVGVRETVSGYRDLSLTGEIEGARAALGASGISCVVHPPEHALPAPVEALLAWTVREGTTNVLRHSNATACEIRMTSTGTSASLSVLDNGVGPSVAVVDGDRTDGNGLVGLAERFASVGGTVQSGPRDGGGFRLHAEVPVS